MPLLIAFLFLFERTSKALILDGLRLQQLEVGLWFLTRDWGRVAVVRAPNPNDYTSGQWQGPGSSALQRRIPTKIESNQVKCLLGEERVQYVWIDTWADSERESHPQGDLNHFYGAFLLGFLWPMILVCLVLSLYLVYLSILPRVRSHLSVKMDSSEEAYG